jgi:hypothetical protein
MHSGLAAGSVDLIADWLVEYIRAQHLRSRQFILPPGVFVRLTSVAVTPVETQGALAGKTVDVFGEFHNTEWIPKQPIPEWRPLDAAFFRFRLVPLAPQRCEVFGESYAPEDDLKKYIQEIVKEIEGRWPDAPPENALKQTTDRSTQGVTLPIRKRAEKARAFKQEDAGLSYQAAANEINKWLRDLRAQTQGGKDRNAQSLYEQALEDLGLTEGQELTREHIIYAVRTMQKAKGDEWQWTKGERAY